MVKAALDDADHPAWEGVIDPAWRHGMRLDVARKPIVACCSTIGRLLTQANDEQLGPEWLAGAIVNNLSLIDRAFEDIDLQFVVRQVKPLIEENRGAVNALSRLTLASGALGASRVDKPTQLEIEREANRLNQARAQYRKKVKS